MIKFQPKKSFYPKQFWPVYEFNPPAGHSCPFAHACKICVDRNTGKFTATGTEFRCYVASAERFPGVRKSRWDNFEAMKNNEEIIIPEGVKYVRIHSSGDFFSQAYFDKWLETCRKYPGVKFWAFTKSIRFWVNRLEQIPENLTLNASRGSLEDNLAKEHNLKYAEVFQDINKVPKDMPIDTDDYYAMWGTQSFALLDNNIYSKKDKDLVDEHNKNINILA